MSLKVKGTPMSAGYDLSASEDVVIPVGYNAIIPTGHCADIPPEHFGLLTLRSGYGFKRDLLCHIGIIDCDYEGEVMVKVFNLGEEDVYIHEGERFAQITVCPYAVAAGTLSFMKQERGTGGFGSTGIQ